MESKQELRRILLRKRKKLRDPEIDQRVTSRLINSNEWKHAKTMMLTVNFGSEINTMPLISAAINEGKTLLLPVCVPKDHSMILRKISDFSEDMVIGQFGILEPKETCPLFSDIDQIDLVLVPGISFTTSGYRLGFGGGFYDRFIPKLSDHCLTVAIVREGLISEVLPIEAHDQPIKMIFTEERKIVCR